MADVALCGNWIHGRCAKFKRMTNTLAIDFKCRKCNGYHENVEDKDDKLRDDVETAINISYLGDRMYSGGGWRWMG